MTLKFKNSKDIQRRAKAFFRSERWNNTLLFFNFVILASGFWTLQYLRQRFEFEVPIEVRYAHIPAGIALSGNPPQEITVYVQDRGGAYLRYLTGKRKQSLFITVDLGVIPSDRTSYVVDQAALRNRISELLLGSTQITSLSLDRIEINYYRLLQKELPVVINGTISPAQGYLLMNSIRIEPAQVVVYGGKDVLDSLRKIQTVPLDYTITDKDWTVSAGLQMPEGTQLSDNQVKLSVTIEEYTEKIFKLPVVCKNTPSNRRVHFFPSTVELSVSVGLSKYAQLTEPDFEIAVDYNDLIEKSTANYSLTLTQKPPWLESYRIAPDIVEFLIEQTHD
jgi:hypothetical protein